MPRRPDLVDIGLLMTFLIGDTAILTSGLFWSVALGLHLCLVIGLWAVGGITRRPLLQVAAVLAVGTGPFGGAIVTTVVIGLMLGHRTPEQHAAWYRLLSGVEHDNTHRTMAQDLLAGRLGEYLPPPRHDLSEIFTRGSRREKQAALRWLSQRDLSGFRDAIRLALDNDDNTIRIEAAALMGRLGNPIMTSTEIPGNPNSIDSGAPKADAGRNFCV